MKFTDKFTFITMVFFLASTMFILMGSLLSIQLHSNTYHRQRIESIVKVIESQIEKGATEKQFVLWLPDLLDENGVVSLQIKDGEHTLFSKKTVNETASLANSLLTYEYQLNKSPDTRVFVQTGPPYSALPLSILLLIVISAVIVLCILLLLKRAKKQFFGAELLEKRAKYLLQNDLSACFAHPGEWPLSASKALDLLSEKLQQSKHFSSPFAQYIRGRAFLDKSTGLGNSLAFDNYLEGLIWNRNVLSSALFIIKFHELEIIEHQLGTQAYHQFLLQLSELLSKFSIRHHEHFIARITATEFVLIIPQMTYGETEVIAKQLTKYLFHLHLPELFYIDDFFHIGAVNFAYGMHKSTILDDVNHALLVATHQKVSGWFMSDDPDEQIPVYKGTVRWRSLLENILDTDRLLLYQQGIKLSDGLTELYSELWPRIKDEQQKVISAGVFLPMADKCGVYEKFDQKTLEKSLALLVARGDAEKPIAVNMSAQILTDKDTHKWLVQQLLFLPRRLRNNLVVEVSEEMLKGNYMALRSALTAIQKMGCKIAVDNVGKSFTDLNYLLDFNIDYLKVYSGLIRNIHLNRANQVILQGVLASCLYSRAKIIAVGVESEEEWLYLLKLGIYAGQGDFFATAVPVIPP
ncbi:EAL domain-containing protein [Psychromonas sp.]|uniref:EAL domain-containing protein n=1 Tax=Psychromonas sp. TaxID=1884585 RepID=UPI0035669752